MKFYYNLSAILAGSAIASALIITLPSSSDRVMAASSANIETELKSARSALGQRDISENSPHLQAQISQTSNWILEFTGYWVRNESCAGILPISRL